MNHESIETVRTFLSPISDEDHAFIYKGMSNHEVTKYYSVHFDTLEDTLEQMRWYMELLENKTGIWWQYA